MEWKKVNAWNKLVMPLRVLDAFILDEFHKIEPRKYTLNKKNPTIMWS
jgi:hypothetical protein